MKDTKISKRRVLYMEVKKERQGVGVDPSTQLVVKSSLN